MKAEPPWKIFCKIQPLFFTHLKVNNPKAVKEDLNSTQDHSKGQQHNGSAWGTLQGIQRFT